MATTELAKVPFYDDVVMEVYQDDRNIPCLHVKPCCDSLGIDYEVQRKKIVRDGSLSHLLMEVMTGKSKRGKRFCTMLAVEHVPAWLTSISLNRVQDPAARAKIERFKKEAYKVLADYFLRHKLTLRTPAAPAAITDGQVQVGIKSTCTRLGLGYSKQLQKLKKSKYATVSRRDTVAADGRTRKLMMVDAESIPIWMAGIQAWRLPDEARANIELFQKEAKDVLAAHFLVKKTKTLPPDVLPPEPAVVPAGAEGNALLATIDAIVRQGNEFVTEATSRTMAIVRDVFLHHMARAADHAEVKTALAALATRVTAAEVVAACGDQMTQDLLTPTRPDPCRPSISDNDRTRTWSADDRDRTICQAA